MGQSITTTQTPAGKYTLQIISHRGASDTLPYTLNIQSRSLKSDQVDLSEMNLFTAYCDTKGADRRVYAYGDITKQVGGHFLMATNYFSSWDGPVEENVQPYSGTAESADDVYIKGNAQYHLQQAIILPSNIEEGFMENLKNAIMTYGVASTNFYSYRTAWTEDGTNYYSCSDYPYAFAGYDGFHEIAVVGWDDTYPKENFTGDKKWAGRAGYGDFAYKSPEQDGAFICKNSWGEDSGENGYFYISYEDACFGNNNPAVYFADELSGNYDTQYINDKYGAITFINGSPSIAVANVFETGNTEEELSAVSFFTGASDGLYDISLRIGDGEPELIAKTTKKYTGYYTEHLEHPITLPANTKYEIIIRYDQSESGSLNSVAFSRAPREYQIYTNECIPNISYRYQSDGTRTDLGEIGYYPCIRAFTNGGKRGIRLYSGEGTTSEQKAASTETYDVNESINGAGAQEEPPQIVSLAGETQEDSLFGSMALDNLGTAGTKLTGVELPEKYDLRAIDAVTPVKNQGSLGSCWTFGSIASLESTLLRSGQNATDRPTGISLDQSEINITLDEDTKEAVVNLQAQIEGAVNPTTTRVNWDFSGDLEGTEVIQNYSFSGENADLLRIKAPGIITLTASSDADINRTASCTVTVVEKAATTPTTPPTGANGSTAAPTSESRTKKTVNKKTPSTGDDTSIAILVALSALSLLLAGTIMNVRRRKR